MKKTDIVIIGSGIAGMSASIYLKLSSINFILLEGNLVGGMLGQLKTIQNFPAVKNTTGNDLLISLMDQLRKNDIQATYGNVQTILKSEEGFEVITDVDSYETKAVIVATGVAQKSSLIVGENKYAGFGVSYCATCDGNFYKGLDVAVVGNNNIAIEEALYLSNLVNKLYFVCPDEKLNGDLELIQKLTLKPNIEFIFETTVDEIVGDDFGVTGMKLNGNIKEISGIFPYIGQKTSTEILNNLKPDMSGIFVNVNEERMTNIPGLFVAGDLVNKKVKQLITAAGDGATAAVSATNYCKMLK